MHRSIAAVIVCGMLAALPALGGMAEMGRKKTLPLSGAQETAGTDTAAGDGAVTILANEVAFTHVTSAGQSVDFILESLEAAINMTGPNATENSASTEFSSTRGLYAIHNPGSSEITVIGLAGAELYDLEILNTDSFFGYVKSMRNTPASRGALLKVTEAPTGLNLTAGAAVVRVDANARFVTVATAGHTAESLNLAIVSALEANSFDAALAGKAIVITADNVTMGPVTAVSWEDDDTGIKSIGCASQILLIGPTLTEWGMIFTGLLLLAGASILLTGRQAAASRRGGGTVGMHWVGSVLFPALFRRWLVRTGAVAVVAFALAGLAFGRPALHDAIGTLAVAVLLASIGHLWDAHRGRRAR